METTLSASTGCEENFLGGMHFPRRAILSRFLMTAFSILTLKSGSV
jgi:hypothetical protein